MLKLILSKQLLLVVLCLQLKQSYIILGTSPKAKYLVNWISGAPIEKNLRLVCANCIKLVCMQSKLSWIWTKDMCSYLIRNKIARGFVYKFSMNKINVILIRLKNIFKINQYAWYLNKYFEVLYSEHFTLNTKRRHPVVEKFYVRTFQLYLFFI